MQGLSKRKSYNEDFNRQSFQVLGEKKPEANSKIKEPLWAKQSAQKEKSERGFLRQDQARFANQGYS